MQKRSSVSYPNGPIGRIERRFERPLIGRVRLPVSWMTHEKVLFIESTDKAINPWTEEQKLEIIHKKLRSKHTGLNKAHARSRLSICDPRSGDPMRGPGRERQPDRRGDPETRATPRRSLPAIRHAGENGPILR
jgi:hypothetical protein